HNAEQQRNVTVENKQSQTQWSLYDSIGRYWYFHNDSTFYYHPEYGLYSRGGFLSVSQEQVRNKQGQQWADSTLYLVDEQSKSSHSSKSALLWYRGWGIIVGIVSILAMIWLYRQKL